MQNRNINITILLVTAFSTAGLAGCAGWSGPRQNVARNTANDVGPTRADRKEALARDFDKTRNDAQFDAAVSYWQRGDIKNCNQILTSLLERDPNNRRARMLLVDVYLFNGQTEQSLEELNKAIAADPKDAVAQHTLAQVLDASGRRTESLAHYEEATRLDPNNEDYSLSYKMALGMIPPTDRDTALAAATDKPADAATSPSPVNRVSQTSSASTAMFDPKVILASNTPSATHPAALQLGAPTDPAGLRPATTSVQPVQSAPPAADHHGPNSPLQKAVEALAAEDTHAAIEIASRGLADTPEQAAALYRVLGAAHYRLGEYQAAQTALAQALSLDKSDGLTYFLMGSTLDKLNDRIAAQQCFSEAARLDARIAN